MSDRGTGSTLLAPPTEAVRGRYLGYPTLTTPTLFIAYTLDGRRVICSSPSHAEVRAAVRAYRGSRR